MSDKYTKANLTYTTASVIVDYWREYPFWDGHRVGMQRSNSDTM